MERKKLVTSVHVEYGFIAQRPAEEMDCLYYPCIIDWDVVVIIRK